MTELDMRKKQCPMPVIEAKKALDKAAPGEVIAVRVDNETAVKNLWKLAASRQEKAERKDLGAEDFVVEITAVSAGAGAVPGSEAAAAEMNAAVQGCAAGEVTGIEKGLVAVISSDRMGEPEETLGKLLMKGFLYALTELDRLPETVIFYNGGARLTAEDSDSLKDLKAMEDAGVEIITCGTCLKHLGLEEKLQVGTVSNMYDIAERMTKANKIVRP